MTPSLPLESNLLSPVKTSWRTNSLFSIRVACSLPEPGFQRRIFRSQPPEASVLPSDENATQFTSAVCPVKRLISLASCHAHSRTVLSTPPEASVLPSGLKASPRTSFSCPRNLPIRLPVISQRLMSLSWLQDAS